MATGMGIVFGMAVVFAALAATIIYTKWKTAQINAEGGCPVCGADVPAFRRPASYRQALRGGWTCENCSTEMDRHGNKLAVR